MHIGYKMTANVICFDGFLILINAYSIPLVHFALFISNITALSELYAVDVYIYKIDQLTVSACLVLSARITSIQVHSTRFKNAVYSL